MQSMQPGGRGRHDDAPVRLPVQVRIGGMGQSQRAVEIDVEDLAKLRQRELVEGGMLAHPGIVHDDVEPAPGVEGLSHHLFA